MKPFIILLLILFAPTITALGQTNEKRISYTTNLGTGLSMSSPSYTPFTWQVMGHYHISQRWAIGVGTGLSVYEKILIPLYASAQFFITKPRKLIPYLECNVGGAFTPNEEASGGFYLSPSIGIQLKISQKLKMNIAIGCELQKLKQLKKSTNEYFATEFEEQLSHNSITLKIGLTL